MQHDWSRHVRFLAFGLAVAAGLGLYLGQLLPALLVALALYLSWTLVQLRRLSRWLGHAGLSADAPHSVGLWGELFDRLHRQERVHQQIEDRLRARIHRVQESTNAMLDGVVMTDSHGKMEWWNDAAEYLLGFRRGTDRGQIVHNLIRTPAFKAYFDARDYREPLQIRSPARPHLRLQVQISLFGDDDRLIVAKDVTRLFQLEQMRRDFVGNVSHEMRTPLTVISGYLETMSDNSDQLPAKWRRAIDAMTGQASRMEALITDLILLSRIETGEHTLHHARINVGQMVGQIVQDARTLSGDRQHQIRLSLESDQWLRGDESELRSAFSNLVFNAVKYTPAGGEIDVSWRTDRNGGYLTVKDTGIGIDPVHIPRLTERFYRADPSRHKDTGGTGLGLAIVKHVLINHDGRLDIHSRPGEGSEFVCHFPKERLVEAGEAPAPQGTATPKSGSLPPGRQ
ncbi:phosphate regulon sensor histidine kinase PhoR [Marinobacter sp. C2H3]|uniref:phosphate regulon sensor histidine kinase PhoR n=1 Tax=Marinobacter sp. C2H3 TaxID=3119003 RepID=UPI00300F41D4